MVADFAMPFGEVIGSVCQLVAHRMEFWGYTNEACLKQAQENSEFQ
ncbi:MAG TPA: hypothetical protein V6D11_25000 [Waterburya sp.]|jgi:hypothetical protein